MLESHEAVGPEKVESQLRFRLHFVYVSDPSLVAYLVSVLPLKQVSLRYNGHYSHICTLRAS